MKTLKLSFLTTFLCFTLSIVIQAQAPTAAWVNELHYDNAGGDVDEFIEIVVNQEFTDKGNFRISEYKRDSLSIANWNGSYLLSTFTVGETLDGFTYYTRYEQLPNKGGLYLDYNGAKIEFLNWGTGSPFTAVGGPGAGETVTDIAPTEDNNLPAMTPPHSIYLLGTYPNLFWTSGTSTIGAVNTDQSLPVELSTFSAIIGKNLVNLQWRTETEVNNYGFEVQRSSETNNWQTLGFVTGNDNSNSPKDYSFEDNSLNASGNYSYRLKQVDNDGTYAYSNIVEVSFGTPVSIELKQNYPNPFNPSTAINFTLPANDVVSLIVYNAIGEQVKVLQNGMLEAGEHSFNFNGEDLPSGLYIYKLATSKTTQVRKMMLLK